MGKIRYKWCYGCLHWWCFGRTRDGFNGKREMKKMKWMKRKSSISNNRNSKPGPESWERWWMKDDKNGWEKCRWSYVWKLNRIQRWKAGGERVRGKGGKIWRASAIARNDRFKRSPGVIAYVQEDVGWKMNKAIWLEKFSKRRRIYSKAYSTAMEHASLDRASWPCWRRLCRVGKKASQAGQECISSKETLLRLEETLEEEPDERERLEVCETWKNRN